MNKQLLILSFFIITFISCDDNEILYIPKNLAEMQFQVEVRSNHPDMNTDLFPSFLYLAENLQAYYKAEDKEVFTDQVIELSFPNPQEGTVVQLSMAAGPLVEPTTWNYTTGTEKTSKVQLPVHWRKEELKKWKITSMITLAWEVEVNHYSLGTLHQSFTCHDIREFPERIITDNREFVGTLKADEDGAIFPAAIILAYVCEDSPLIKDLLDQAIAEGVIDRFDGYMRGEEQLVKQLEAMWYVLLEKNMTYGNYYFVPGYWYVRRLRFIDEILNSRTGNCMELPLLLIAMCKQAGIDVVSFHVDNNPQDHMFMGFLNAEGEIAHVLNPAYLQQMHWDDLPQEERFSKAAAQLRAYLSISKIDYETYKPSILSGVPHHEMIHFDKVRKYIPSLYLK